MAMMRKRLNKIPPAFYIIFLVVIIASISFVIWLPLDIPSVNTYSLKVLIACGMILGISLLAVWIYAKKFRR